MGYINLPNLDEITQIKDPKQQMEMLINTVGILMKSLSELNGYINSKNVSEIGGYRVSNTDLQSADGDVGLSSANDALDPVRIWAGGAVKEQANFRVPKSGKMHATGATIESASGYPRVELNSINNLIAAFSAPGTYIAFMPQGYGLVPSLVFLDANTTKAFLNRAPVGGTTLGTFDGENLNFQPSGNLQIGGSNGISSTVYVSAISGGPATVPIAFTKGIRTS